MSYIPTAWIDHVNSGNRYNIFNNDDGTKEIVYAGEVLQQGTPMSAENLNHMEQGILDASQTADKAKTAADNIGNTMNLTGTRITNLEQKTSDMYSKSEVFEIIVQKIAEIVAGAPEDFDTLKEMSDWITNHADSAAEMNTAITKNSKDILLLEENTDSAESNIALNMSTLGFRRKNLLKLYRPPGYTWTHGTGLITWVFNDDYSVSATVTSEISEATGTIGITIAEITLKPGIYIYSVEGYSTPSITHTQLYTVNADGSIKWLKNFAAVENKITVTEETTYRFLNTRNNLVTVGVTETIYPMLRYADITDSTFEPYSESADERFKKFEQQPLLYSSTTTEESPLTVNIPGLFKNYSAVICQINTSNTTGRYNLTLPLKYIKSIGTGSYYSADSQIMFEYADDNNLCIRTGMGQSNPTMSGVKIISLY
ncbi:MAG: hypothetical protein E7508_11230 [Ruminococcus sp.]|nr:hypothetical protein [Ruminococcus sp.]